jgi:metal-responsive CopG/Arc/MetJ family transcriptional regulator
MPNVRGDKRRTIVCPDDLWEAFGRCAAKYGSSSAELIRGLMRDFLAEDARATEPVKEPAEPA